MIHYMSWKSLYIGSRGFLIESLEKRLWQEEKQVTRCPEQNILRKLGSMGIQLYYIPLICSIIFMAFSISWLAGVLGSRPQWTDISLSTNWLCGDLIDSPYLFLPQHAVVSRVMSCSTWSSLCRHCGHMLFREALVYRNQSPTSVQDSIILSSSILATVPGCHTSFVDNGTVTNCYI